MLKELSLLAICAMLIQTIIIILVSQKHKSRLSKKSAFEYPKAISQLIKTNRAAGWTLRACYLLSLIELTLLAITAKFN